MNIYKKYTRCVYCNSRKLTQLPKQYFPDNFYLDVVKADLLISKKEFSKIKSYKCNNCYILQNNPWFSENISHRIYSNIYGQHNKGWSNCINFFKKKKLPDHGKLFEILKKEIKITNYAEYNSPFMGLFLNFFSEEYQINKIFLNEIFKNSISYLNSRQVAGNTKKKQKNSIAYSKVLFKKIKILKKKHLINKKVRKYLFIDNSSLCWGQNDNYKSANSKSLASELFDLQIINIDRNFENVKTDLFGIFLTLDHTFEPKKILDFALNTSKYVIIYCHVDTKINKQHLFSLTTEFLKYLKRQKIYTLDLTLQIKKNQKKPELYFLCSRNKIKINYNA
jgi:hypothetical protein